MSRKFTGLGLSSHSPARHKAVTSEANDACKRPLKVGFGSTLWAMILVVVVCSAGALAERSSAAAYSPAHTDTLESFLRLDFRLLNETTVFMVCLLVAAGLSCARLRTDNSGPRWQLATKRIAVPSMQTVSSFKSAREDERKHLSRELHDSVGPVLTAVGLQLSALRSGTLSPEQLREGLDETRRLNAEALRLVRDLAMGLRPALLDDVNLGTALEWQARQFSRQTGIAASVEICGELEELPATHRTCIYRCVQEALTNCAKYAQATSVRLTVSASSESVNIKIHDDGVGFDEKRTFSKGLGLVGMRERLAGVNGKLVIESGQEEGTKLTLEIPVLGSVLA